MPAIVSFLAAGCGFGGSCLPKDVETLHAHGEKFGVPMRILDAVLQINEQQPQKVTSLLKKHFPSLRGVRVTILAWLFDQIRAICENLRLFLLLTNCWQKERA